VSEVLSRILSEVYEILDEIHTEESELQGVFFTDVYEVFPGFFNWKELPKLLL
jgi:hypothetical protein